VLLLALACFSGAAAAQDAFTNRATELKTSPSPDAATVAPVPQETPVKVLGRQSGWTQIQAGDKSGWVRAFHLRFQSTVSESREGNSGGGLLGGLFGGSKRQTPKGTSTVGIRGLSTEELQGAAPNLEALARLQGLRADAPTAQRFAADGKLVAVKVDYVEAEAEPPRKGGRR
jgi:hypothetical protein